jgi:hypothetical protein
MEQKGMLMHVHLPEHSSELIKGDAFQFKEKGEVDVQEKTYRIIVVTRHDNNQ